MSYALRYSFDKSGWKFSKPILGIGSLVSACVSTDDLRTGWGKLGIWILIELIILSPAVPNPKIYISIYTLYPRRVEMMSGWRLLTGRTVGSELYRNRKQYKDVSETEVIARKEEPLKKCSTLRILQHDEPIQQVDRPLLRYRRLVRGARGFGRRTCRRQYHHRV